MQTQTLERPTVKTHVALAVAQVDKVNPKPVDLKISEEECFEGLVALKTLTITPGTPVTIEFLGHTLTFEINVAQ